MRQLDLFGMFAVEPEPNASTKAAAAKHNQEPEPAEVAGSVVAIAEEVLAGEVFLSEAQIVEELPPVSGDFSGDSFSVHTINKVGVNDETPEPEFSILEIIEVAEITIDQPGNLSAKAPERVANNSAVVFTDGKIGVKIKAKPVPAKVAIAEPAVIKTGRAVKVKKEKVKKVPQKRGRKSFKEIDAEVDLIELPDDEELFKKQYYPISEVAKWFRVNTSLLRFWENEFDILKPRKNRKGDRLFRPEDVKNLELIYQLLRQRKFTIDGAKDYLKANKKKADVQLHLTTTLQKFKSFLLELKANLQV